jgi:MSHA biogenesis protein MshJ
MNMPLIKYYKTIDQLPVAARSMILTTILGLIFIVWYYTFWQKLQLSITFANNKIETLKPTITQLDAQTKTLEKELAKKRAAFNKAVNMDRDKPVSPTTSLLSPHQTIKVLHDILITNNKLVLLQLKNTPAKETSPTQSNSKVFEHEIMIKFSGDYFSTMSYLQAIEKLKWKIFWDKLEYKVIQYPMAEITLHIHTISTIGDWIHV